MFDSEDKQFSLVIEQASTPEKKLRILILKLDHHGDFVICLPSVERLREAFPNDHLTLVCGRWNEAIARRTGLVDEVLIYNFYAENILASDRHHDEDIERLRQLTSSGYDLAIDLRVEPDTRALLRVVEAQLRCGIGSRSQFPFLDITLPMKGAGEKQQTRWSFPPESFATRMKRVTPFLIETDFSVTDTHMVWGPYVELPEGRYRAIFVLEALELGNQPLSSPIILDIAFYDHTTNSGIAVASMPIDEQQRNALLSGQLEMEFVNTVANRKFEFRIHVKGRPFNGVLRFRGLQLECVQTTASAHVRTAAEVHVGEALNLLVELIKERVRPAESRTLRYLSASALPSDSMQSLTPSRNRAPILISPFSNSALRNWPTPYYVELISQLLNRTDVPIGLLGSPSQANDIERIIEDLGDHQRLTTLAGKINWVELAVFVRCARLVIANNSGVAHLAAAAGVPTLAIYSGSHTTRQWGPRGPRVRTLTARLPCAPCGHDRLKDCDQEHRCMRLITPTMVLEHVLELIAAGPNQP
jgi:ADP-heptose:LPS heptosyltransferase